MNPNAYVPIIILSGLALGASITFDVCAADTVDADNLAEATQMVFLDRDSVERDRLYCDSVLPGDKFSIDYAAFAWTVENSAEISAVDAQLTGAQVATFNKLSTPFSDKLFSTFREAVATRGASSVCKNFAAQLRSPDQDIAHRRPAASRYLLQYLKNHPLPQKVVEWNDSMRGCQKQAFNKDADFDTWQPICRCGADIQSSEWSEADRKQVNEAYAAGASASTLEPLQRIMPQVRACIAKVQQGH